MNNLKVAIIEDEVPAARLLHSMLKRLRPNGKLWYYPEISKKRWPGSMQIHIRNFYS